jgi:head-tail adaptor
MRAGKLDRLIDVEALTTTKGSSGGVQKTWGALAGGSQVWASMRNLSGREAQASNVAGGNVSRATVEWELRYIAGVTATGCRIKHDGLYYNITHVNDVGGRHEKLVIQTEIGVNNG